MDARPNTFGGASAGRKSIKSTTFQTAHDPQSSSFSGIAPDGEKVNQVHKIPTAQKFFFTFPFSAAPLQLESQLGPQYSKLLITTTILITLKAIFSHFFSWHRLCAW